ncbi:hypothetical protein CQA53_05905 [Helicobacter didelphidarum]|uniref:Methyltransferase type 11 domain-containing protein n=1 Tax=Helicobacter didelphidarum TaxID=2040648 RepID=A0A3D8IM21_9HELI|nr:hypothetical protein [Helicobacter didelphidarum]RDU65694.1 hypothetical protein CQA53_05905 [Helicobacter didelphidarum]
MSIEIPYATHTKQDSNGGGESLRKKQNNIGASGAGSYNHLAVFKAEVLNNFVAHNHINCVLEWGCGDGNQLSLFTFPHYIGLDVSATTIANLKQRFGNDFTHNKRGDCGSREFYLVSEYLRDRDSKILCCDTKRSPVVNLKGQSEILYRDMKPDSIERSEIDNKCLEKNERGNINESFARLHNQSVDLAISLDVIYHLIDNRVFEEYMANLFASSAKFVIIYASNKDEIHAEHVRHRKFSAWIEANASEWRLREHIPNKYPFNPKKLNSTSFADFYVYEKTV